MSEDYINQSGRNKEYADDRGGSTLYSNPIIGIVKNNIDLYKSGKIQVYLKRQNLPNQDNPAYWTTVSYMSPFFGNTPNTGSPDSAGNYVGNPNSYGFWATPPDIGTEVVCVFINGDSKFGFYIGCVPQPALTHMVPAIGASDNVIPNGGEATGYGGATRLPVTEYNNANEKQDNSPNVTSSPRPIHSYQAAILNAQGLIRDKDRGVIGSSSMRESPSRVFGMSTPGRPIYEGGYTDESISGAVTSDTQPGNFKVIGRRGGHSIVMDDGDLQGRDQLTRIRTAGGHMIMMNDFAQTLFIIHANGSSYIELGKEGTIDLYSTNSVNVRTQGDLNLHADNNININAKEDLNISAKNLHVESIEDTTQYTGKTFKHYTEGDHTLKVDSRMTFESKGDSMVKSGGTNYVKGGPNVNLNTGESGLAPEIVKQITIIAHSDTLRDQEKGYIPAPGKLPSIVTRAPAHMPWINANQGVDVKTDLSADANLPPMPPSDVQKTNASVSSAPMKPTTPAIAATVPQSSTTSSDSNNIGGTDALVSQAAVNVSSGPAASAIAAGAGVVSIDGAKTAAVGALGLNPQQLASTGIIKPGTDATVNALIQKGSSIAEAMPPNIFTGKDGITSVTSLVTNTSAQAKSMSTLIDTAKTELTNSNIITGAESLSQTGGVILASALNGTGPVVDFMKQAASGNIAAATTSAEGLKASLFGSIETNIKSGNFAGNLADKATGALGGIDVGDSLKGAAAGAFSKIKDTLKNLKANVPQRLDGPQESGTDAAAAEKEETPEEKQARIENNAKINASITNALGLGSTGSLKTALENAGSTLQSTTSGPVATTPEEALAKMSSATSALSALLPGVSANLPIPGGIGAFTNIVKADSGSITAAAGTSQLQGDVKSLVSSISSGFNDLKSKVSEIADKVTSKGALSALASSGLPKGIASELDGAISSLGAGGAVKAPTVAFDTNAIGGLIAQSTQLLGNPKIPPINLGTLKIPTTPLSKEKTAEYDQLTKELNELDDLKFDYRKDYLNAIRDYGKDAAETAAAKTKYEDTLKQIEELRKKLADISQGK